jgi:hypothetical protein
MHAGRFIVLSIALLALFACGQEAPKVQKGEQGPPGPMGPAGPPGPPGPAGTTIRSIVGDCGGTCIVACGDGERILSAFAVSPGGTFVYESEARSTFRPEQPGAPVKVILACIPK